MSDDHSAPRADGDALSAVAARWQGLLDPDADDITQRLEALRFYESVGVEASAFDGVAPNNLLTEINRRVLAPAGTIDRATAQEASGLNREQFEHVCHAAGYDPDGAFTELDIQAFTAFGLASAFFTADELEPLIRVLRSLMSHLADALTAVFRIDVSVPMDDTGATLVDYARKNYESAQLLHHVAPTLEAFLMSEMRDAIDRSDQSRQELETSSTATVKMAIGFVDIVGYTPIADNLEPDELSRFILGFERAASDAVVAGGGRIVKLIGDEVMFVVVDPSAAFTIARNLISAFEDSEATPRGGVIHGELIARGGDYYGRLVNMASRIAALAVPGEILTDVATAEAATAHVFEHGGRRMLKGFAEPVELRSLT